MEHLFFPVTRREAERSGVEYSSEINKNAGFPSRLRKLRKEKGVSQDTVSKELGVSKSTLGLWETGDTLPDAKAIFDLSIYYDVSTDYLLGKTDIASVNMKTREVCEYIGLTQDTVSMLSVYTKQGEIISSFLARFFEDIVVINDRNLDKINSFLVNAAQADAIDKAGESEPDTEIDNIIDAMNGTHKGQYKISAKNAKWYFLTQAKELAKGSIDWILEIMEEELCENYNTIGFVSKAHQKRIWKLLEDDDR